MIYSQQHPTISDVRVFEGGGREENGTAKRGKGHQVNIKWENDEIIRMYMLCVLGIVKTT